MILNKQTWENLKSDVRKALSVRSDFAFISSPVFHDSAVQGVSILTGGLVGLLFWSAIQTTPPRPVYQFVLSLQTEAPQQAPVPSTSSPALTPAEKSPETKTKASPPSSFASPTPVPASPDHPTPAEQPPAHKDTLQVQQESEKTTAPDKITLPLSGLTESNPTHGDLPIVRESDHLRPFDAYKKPFPTDALKKPLIVVMMLDYGLSEQASKSVLGVFPQNVNFVLSSTARNGKAWTQQAYDSGHEVWLELSVEPENYPLNDPGAQTLMTSASVEKNNETLLAQLGRAAGYAGIFVPEHTPYFSSGADADFVSNIVFERGLGLAINSTHTDRVVRTSAIEKKAPFYTGQMLKANDPDHYQDLFKTAEDQAKRNGFSIVLFSPTKSAQEAILNWVQNLKPAGFELAPLSVISERGADLSQ